jgi:threonine synthase
VRSLEGAALRSRIEAFEDVIDRDVGDTDLVRARNLERRYGLSQLYLKFEGGNPTGTQKDRIAFAQVGDALRRGFDRVVVASCGNYGAAIALACQHAGLACEVVLPATYKAPREGEIRSLGAEVVRLGADYEASVVLARRRAAESDAYDANPGGENVIVQLNAYGQIATELYDELRDAPRAVAISVSNGTTLAGIWRGFERLERRGRVSRRPWMIAGSTFRKNPIIAAWKAGRSDCPDLEPSSARETAVNEPLVNWHAEDGEQTIAALRASGGFAGDVTDRQMRTLAREVRTLQGLDVQPASTAGLAALLQRHAAEPLPPDRYVAVLTGRNG